MARLIPLSSIPYAARETEARERAKWPTRAMALDAATYEIVLAPGCYGGAVAPTVGWVLTSEAADALAAIVTHMPGGSSHRRLRWEHNTSDTSEALGEYVAARARNVPEAEAIAAYQARRS